MKYLNEAVVSFVTGTIQLLDPKYGDKVNLIMGKKVWI